MPTSSQFSNLAEKAAKKIARNALNAQEVKAFVAVVAKERFGALAEDKSARLSAWLSSAASRWLIREGRAEPVSELPGAADAAGGDATGKPSFSESAVATQVSAPEPWAVDALARGEELWSIVLDDKVRRQLGHIADWIASDEPRQLGKVSFEQAIRATAAWDKRLRSRTAQEEDAAGIAFVADAPRAQKDYPGAHWVRLSSAQALNREGALMGHCVGSYAEVVASEKTEIYSLRDMNNKPLATAEMQLIDIESVAKRHEGWSVEAIANKRARIKKGSTGLSLAQYKGRFNAIVTGGVAESFMDLAAALDRAGRPVIDQNIAELNGFVELDGEAVSLRDAPASTEIYEAKTQGQSDAMPFGEGLVFKYLTITSADANSVWPKTATVNRLTIDAGVKFLDVSGWAVTNVKIANPFEMQQAELFLGEIKGLRNAVPKNFGRGARFAGDGFLSAQRPLKTLRATVREADIPWLRVDDLALLGAEKINAPGLDATRASFGFDQNKESDTSIDISNATIGDVEIERCGTVRAAGAIFGAVAEKENFTPKTAVQTDGAAGSAESEPLDSRAEGNRGEDSLVSPEKSRREAAKTMADKVLALAVPPDETEQMETLQDDVRIKLEQLLGDQTTRHLVNYTTRMDPALTDFLRVLSQSAGMAKIQQCALVSAWGEEPDLSMWVVREDVVALNGAPFLKKWIDGTPKSQATIMAARSAMAAFEKEGSAAASALSEEEIEAFGRFASASSCLTFLNPDNDPGRAEKLMNASEAAQIAQKKRAVREAALAALPALDRLLPMNDGDEEAGENEEEGALLENGGREGRKGPPDLREKRRAALPTDVMGVAPRVLVALDIGSMAMWLDPQAPAAQLVESLAKDNGLSFRRGYTTGEDEDDDRDLQEFIAWSKHQGQENRLAIERLDRWLAGPHNIEGRRDEKALNEMVQNTLAELFPFAQKLPDSPLREWALPLCDAAAAKASLSRSLFTSVPKEPNSALAWALEIISAPAALPSKKKAAISATVNAVLKKVQETHGYLDAAMDEPARDVLVAVFMNGALPFFLEAMTAAVANADHEDNVEKANGEASSSESTTIEKKEKRERSAWLKSVMNEERWEARALRQEQHASLRSPPITQWPLPLDVSGCLAAQDMGYELSTLFKKCIARTVMNEATKNPAVSDTLSDTHKQVLVDELRFIGRQEALRDSLGRQRLG